MSLTQRGSDGVLVGILLIVVDFQIARGLDVVPDVVGWVLLAVGMGKLLGIVQAGPVRRLWSVARAGGWAMVGVSGLLVLLALSGLVGLDVVSGALSGGVLLTLLVGSLVVEQGVLAALGRGGELRATTWGAPSAVKWLRIGWITAAVVGGAYALLGVNILLGGALNLGALGAGGVQGLLRLAGLAAGVIVGVGLSKARNEGVLD